MLISLILLEQLDRAIGPHTKRTVSHQPNIRNAEKNENVPLLYLSYYTAQGFWSLNSQIFTSPLPK